MIKEKRKHYAQKHPPDQEVDPRIAEALRDRAEDGEISCASVFALAAELGKPPGKVGLNADLLEIRVVKCQLGLFGYRPRKKILKPPGGVSEDLEEPIRKALEDGRLPCRAAWDIAESLNVGKMEVSSACEGLGIRISSCQLGAF
ncbi:MAG: hypothetical protein V1689_10855 [Pseudomonadota bacterium]